MKDRGEYQYDSDCQEEALEYCQWHQYSQEEKFSHEVEKMLDDIDRAETIRAEWR